VKASGNSLPFPFSRLPGAAQIRSFAGDFFGAFADSAILLPLVMLLARVPGFSLPVLLGSAGLAYLAAGRYFRVPVPVQPLKSVAIASITLGAGALEIRAAGFLLGLFFFVLFLLKTKELPIPEPVVRSVQAGLGVLLLFQAWKALPAEQIPALRSAALLLMILILQFSFRVASLGFFALVFFLGSLTTAKIPAGSIIADFAPAHAGDWKQSLSMIASLLLPQIALTSANSITGAALASRHYFGEKGGRVTPSRLMFFLGSGNLLMACFKGLPFCHGAGGLTAHVRGGANSARMNLIMGTALLLLSGVVWFRDLSLLTDSFALPAILACVGIFHLELARPLLRDPPGRIMLALSCAVIFFTSDLLWVLLSAFAVHGIRLLMKRGSAHA
jgi:SulP family sulfate permease